MAKKTIYRMNIDLAGYKKGAWWEKGTEPLVVTKWARLNGGSSMGRQIITIEKRDPIELGKKQFETSFICPKCGYDPSKDETDLDEQKNNETKIDTRVCKGVKSDGTPCEFSGNRVRENGYCFMHQDQAPKEEATESPDDIQKMDEEEIFKPDGISSNVNEPEEGES